jgi:hypothetical protein
MATIDLEEATRVAERAELTRQGARLVDRLLRT